MRLKTIARAFCAAAFAIALIQLVPPAAQAQDKQAAADKAQAQRDKDMKEWMEKGGAYQKEQSAINARRKACSAQAKAQKLHFKKRRDFIKTCMAG